VQSIDTSVSAAQRSDGAAEAKRTTVVRAMSDADQTEWNNFVFGAHQATFFHRAEWRTIFEHVFHLKTHYLIAERGGQIVGLLPLVHQRSLLFGDALVAAPFCVEGGPLAKDTQARDALDQAALQLFERTRARYVEFRSRNACRPGWQVRRGLYADFSRPLSADDQENLRAIPRKQRAVVRKTLTGNLISEIDSQPDRLFRVYSESVRNLGTPMFPRRYFSVLLQSFGSDCDIVAVLDDGSPVSAVMNFYFKDGVMPYYGGGTAAARANGANDFLYWEVMRRAAERGYRRFDFGRSKFGTGSFAFKKNWGFEPSWLEYEYWMRPGTALPEKNPLNPKYALFIAAWKHLPVPLANALGPFLIRNLG
jgi:FemAB-related protein (PEP-CTERM system-associated)